jgi:hypothetical protein
LDELNFDSFINFFKYFFTVKADCDYHKTKNTTLTSSSRVRADLSFANRMQTQNIITSSQQPVLISSIENPSSNRTSSLKSKFLQDSVRDSRIKDNTLQSVENLKLDLVDQNQPNTGNNNNSVNDSNNHEYLSIFYRTKRKAC